MRENMADVLSISAESLLVLVVRVLSESAQMWNGLEGTSFDGRVIARRDVQPLMMTRSFFYTSAVSFMCYVSLHVQGWTLKERGSAWNGSSVA